MKFSLLLLCLTTAPATAQIFDWGDAPASYQTIGATGARHQVVANFWLGASGPGVHIDDEAAGQPSVNADGDDTNGVDDEDGVAFYSSPTTGVVPWQIGSYTQADVTVTLPQSVPTARVDAWVDFNADGDFADAGEHVLDSVAVTQGTHPLGFFIPPNAVPGPTYARFRLGTALGQTFSGPASNGEVEDYKVTLVPPSAASLVRAHTWAGQVWITWDFVTGNPAQLYEIYRSAVPITDASQGELVAALYPGEYAAGNLTSELTSAFGAAANQNFRIPDATGVMQTLPLGRGLCVDTIRSTGTYYYSVVPHGFTAIAASNRTPTALTSTFAAANIPRPHPQQTGTVQGFPITFFNLWVDGDDTTGAGLPTFPLMANRARRCTPHLLFIMQPPGGVSGPGPHPVSLALHSGDARAEMWLPDRPGFFNVGAQPLNGYLVALEDKIYQMLNGVPNADNTNWIGYVPTFNPFQNAMAYEGMISPGPQFQPPAGSVIQPYTLNRINWTLDWLLQNSALNIDSNRVSIFGHSGGGKGTLIWSRTFPQRFAHVNVFAPEIATEFNAGGNIRMFGTSTIPDPADTPASPGSIMIPGDNFVVAGLTNSAGGPVHFEDLYHLESDVSPQRDLPPMRFYYGLREDNWTIDYNHDFKPEILTELEISDTQGTGAVLHWDLRLHGPDKWTLANAAAPLCPFVADDFWVATTATQTRRDDVSVAERYRNDESYPACYNLRNRTGHDTPGIVDYGTPPAFYDDIQPWTDPTPLDCYGVPVTEGANNRGTWGGYFDWFNGLPNSDPRTLRDATNLWATSLFLTQSTDGAGRVLAAVDECAALSLTTDVAIRRPQLFRPAANTLVHWMACEQATRRVLQTGSQVVGADTVVRLPNVTVPKAPAAVRVIAATEMDFGDAPAGYPVTLAEDGARHATDGELVLGNVHNTELDGQHHPLALSATENDDGVSFPNQWAKESRVQLTVTVSAACRLDAWIDWAADGNWSASDNIATSRLLMPGANNVTIFIPATAHEGVTYARFRVSLGGGLQPTGPAPDGEVEDYPIHLTPALSPSPPTLQFATNGQGATTISWQGNPAYSSQFEHSSDLVAWHPFGLPVGETSGINVTTVPASLLTGSRQFFRLVRQPLSTSPIPLPAPGAELDHQFITQTFVSDGIARNYRLKLPNNWTPSRSWPLVLLLPGHTQSAAEFWEKRAQMLDIANTDGWIICCAEATAGEESYRWMCYDNPAHYTAPFAASNQPWLDDYGYIKSLVNYLLASGLNIDPARVYEAGFSNGGNMSHYIASKPDHPFAAFAMIESGVEFQTHYNDPITGLKVYASVPQAAKARPVLINNQLDSMAWPYEGRTALNDPAWTVGAPSPGALQTVARWTVGNGLGGTAAFAPPTPTSLPAAWVFVTPAPTLAQTPPWVTTNGRLLLTPSSDLRPDLGWPATLATQPGWNNALAQFLPYGQMPPVPATLRALYPHTIEPNNPTLSIPPFSIVKVTSGTWTVQVWRSAPANSTNEVVLVTLSDGGHNWPEADSPWNANVEVLRFFGTH